MARPLPNLPLGVYVHFPYCVRLCPYCDFTVFVRREIPHKAYAAGLLAELDVRQAEYPNRQLRSIYFGGGTPGLFEVSQIRRVIQEVRGAFDAGAVPLEVTVEVNPEHVTEEGLAALLSAGVNRLSFGIQSFDDGVLKALGRKHSGQQARDALTIVERSGVGRFSADLIFASPGQNKAGFEEDLASALAFERLGHLSLYQLTIEPRTVFGRQVLRGRMKAPDGNIGADLFDFAETYLEVRGFEHYEVSSYAKPGEESQHNGLYWTGAEYLGLGVGAHSLRFDDEGRTCRRGNGRDLKAYLRGGAFDFDEELLSDEVHLGERLMIGLRTQKGVDLEILQGALDVDILALVGPEFRRLVDEGWLNWEGNRVWPTPQGLRFADRVGERLLLLG